MSASDIIVVILVIFVIKALRRLFRDTSYIGYGWRLGWREGKVVVVSRLLDSPSGHANVRIGSIVLKYQGKNMDFESATDFSDFMRSIPHPELGQVAEFVLYDGSEKRLSLEARRIQGPIPVHRRLPPLDPSDEWMYRQGMFMCRRTGQLVFTRSLSDAGLRALYG